MSSSADPFLRQRTDRLWRTGAAWRTFLRRWGISLASLASGLVTLLIFRRGVPHVGWIIGYVVGLWLLFAVLSQARDALLAGGRHLVVAAGDYTIQTLYHGLLLFVLPGYFASTTFDGITVVFFAVLAAAALLTTVDPWYRAVVHPRPWLGLAFFGFSLFAGLNVALPLVGVPPAAAVVLSAALGALGLTPTFFQRAGRWGPAAARAGAVALLAVGAAWIARPAVPPAPVSLVHPTLARAVADLEPVEPVARISLTELRAWGGLTAFTPVAAPAALHQAIEHRWRHEGRVVSTVRLAHAGAGRPAGRLPHLLPKGRLPARRPGSLDGGRGDRLRPADRPPPLPGGRVTVLFDTHAHLHDPAFDADRAAVIARARAAGVAGFLTIGTDEAHLGGGGRPRRGGARRLRRRRHPPARRRARRIRRPSSGSPRSRARRGSSRSARSGSTTTVTSRPGPSSGPRSSPSSGWRGPSGSPSCSIAGRRTRISSTSARPRGSPPSAGSSTASRATSRWRAAASTSGS